MDIDTSEVWVLAAELEASNKDVRAGAVRVVKAISSAIVRDAKILAPVDTGTLMNSISSTVSGTRAEIGPSAHYGIYVELGTSKMAPQPYLFPAADRHINSFAEQILDLGLGW